MDAEGIGQATFHLLAGAATSVLTDVEGSTRVPEPEVVGVAVARHDELLDEAISRHGGVRRLADDEHNVVAVFTRASDAVAAALDVSVRFILGVRR